MTVTDRTHAGPDNAHGPKYKVDLEGELREWPSPTITVPELRGLAGWSPDQPIVVVDLKTNEERDLREDEVIDLKPGQGFSKKIKFKRGSK